MKYTNGKKLILSIFMFSVLLLNVNGILFNGNFNGKIGPDIKEGEKGEKNENGPVGASNYKQDCSGSGSTIEINAGMTYFDNVSTSMDKSKSGNTTLSALAPVDNNFNSTSISLNVGNITTLNKTQYINTFESRSSFDISTPLWASITVPSSCYISNVSTYLTISGTITSLKLYVYKSTWNSTHNIPDQASGKLINATYSLAAGTKWYTFLVDQNSSTYLNTGETSNNTWYILMQKTGSGSISWYYEVDSPTTDDSDSYYIPDSDLLEYFDSNKEVDFAFTVSYCPSTSSIVKPSQIGLKVNGTAVSDSSGFYSGVWTSNTVMNSGGTGAISFSFTADYWLATWEVANITINYKKSDMSAVATFNSQLESTINWEINKSITAFELGFQNYYIKFIVPDVWTIGKAYDWTTEYNPVENDITGPFKEAIIYNAVNDDQHDWSLRCTSENFGKEIGIYADGGSTNITVANYSNVLAFKAGFADAISGDVNLTVFSPSGWINYTSVNASLVNKQYVWFDGYDISVNLTEYGEFAVQYFWSNSTHVAFWEQKFNINADTDLSITSANNGATYTNEDMFKFTVYYEDTGRTTGITDATITYSINGATPTSNFVESLGAGSYNITIHSWDVTAFGPITVVVNASKNNYNLASTVFTFNRYNATTKSLDQDTFTQIKNTNITINAHYMDNKSIGIPNANVIWGANDPNWEYKITNAGAGLYTIELNASKLVQTTNPYTVLFSIESGFNVTQSYSVTVNVLNRTEVKIVSLQQVPYSHTDAVAPYNMYYGADITVNVQLIDLDNGNAILTGGQANLTYNSITYYDLVDDAGTFSITIPTSAVDVANNIPITEIAINNTGSKTATTSTSFNINTCPTYITIESVTVGGNGLSYNGETDTYEGQRWGQSSNVVITISYYNAINNQKISAATRDIEFNGASAGSGSDSSGTYQWTIGPASSHINNNTVSASFSKTNYESQADTFGVWLNTIATSLTLAYPTANNSITNPSEDFIITVYYSDDTPSPISDATVTYSGDLSGNANPNGTAGYYEIKINSIALAGNYSILIWANKSNYENKSFYVKFYINSAPTITDQSTLLNLAYWNKTENFVAFDVDFASFEDDVDKVKISDSLTWSIIGTYSTFTWSSVTSDTLRFTAVANAVGIEWFTLRVTDAYGLYSEINIQFNVTGYLNIAITSGNNNSIYYNNNTFDINISLHRNATGAPFTTGTLRYSVNGGAFQTAFSNEGSGNYKITIHGWDIADFGEINIVIESSATYYYFNYTLFRFTKYNATQGSLNNNQFNVIKYQNFTIIGTYQDNNSVGIKNAVVGWDAGNPACEHWIVDNGDGTYSIMVNSSQLLGSATAYTLRFTISSQWNQTQNYEVSVYVANRTQVWIISLSQPSYGVVDTESPYNLYYGADILVKVKMVDIDNNFAVVTGGMANLTYNPTLYNLTDVAGEFSFLLSTSTYAAAGSPYLISNIWINATNFQTSSNSTNYYILPCPTTHTSLFVWQYGSLLNNATGNYKAWFGAGINVTFEYRNAFTTALITLDSGTITFGGTWTDQLNGGGLVFNITDFDSVAVGTDYTLTVKLNNPNYSDDEFIIKVDIQTCPTYIVIDSVMIGGNGLSYNAGTDTYQGQRWSPSSNLIITISYYNGKNNQKIGAATRNIDFNGASIGSGSDSSGTYQWTIAPINSHIFNNTVDASFSKANYESQADTFGVWLNQILTNLVLSYPTGNYSIQNPTNVFTITVYYSDDTPSALNGATITYSGSRSGSVMVTNGTDGYYSFNIDCNGLSAGNHSILVWANKSNYENKSFYVNFYINSAPTIKDQTTLLNLAHWNKTENFVAFNVGFVSFEDDVDKNQISDSLTWSIIGTYSTFTWSSVTSDTLRFTAVANAVGIEWFTLRVTDSYGLSAQIDIQFNVTGLLNIAITSGNNNSIYYNNNTFDINISLHRNATGAPFTTGTLRYSVNGGAFQTAFSNEGSGNYKITIHGWDIADFGEINIVIESSATYYYFNYTLFRFTKYNATQATLDNTIFTVIKNNNITIIAHYLDNNSVGIPNANLIWSGGNHPNWIYSWTDNGNGQYSLEVNSTAMLGSATAYTISFTISSGWNQSKTYQVSVSVLNRTQVWIISLSQPSYGVVDTEAPYNLYYGANILVKVKLVDIDNNFAVVTGGMANLTYNPTLYNLTDVAGEFSFILSTSSYIVTGTPYSISSIWINATNFQTSSNSTNYNILACPTTHNDLKLWQYGREIFNASGNYQAYFGAGINVTFEYRNAFTGSAITLTSATITFTGGPWVDQGTGNTRIFNITSFESQNVGTNYELNVQLNSGNYNLDVFKIYVDILACPTRIENISYYNDHGILGYNSEQNKYSAKIDSDVTIIVMYNNTINGAGISGATARLWNSTDIEGVYHYNITASNGFVTFYIYHAQYSSGQIITFKINLTLSNYQSYEILFKLEWVNIQTNAYIYWVNQTGGVNIVPYGAPNTYDALRGMNTTIIAFYNNTDTQPYGEGISGATATLTFNGIQYITTTNATGYAEWTICTFNITDQLYATSILFQKDQCVEQTINFRINVKLINTNGVLLAIYQPDHGIWGLDNLSLIGGKYQAYMSYNLSINCSYEDLVYGGWINDATGTLWFNGQAYSHSSVKDGVYTWNNIPIWNKVGDYIITIEINKTDWKNASFTFTISINRLPVNIYKDSIYHVVSGTDRELEVNGDNLVAYKYYDTIYLVMYLQDENNTVRLNYAELSFQMRIRNSIGTVVYSYHEGTYNSGDQTITWTISTTALSMATGLYYFDFNFIREYYESKSVTYNISLQRLDSSSTFNSIRQFGQTITPTLGKYIVYDSVTDKVTIILNFIETLYNTKVNGLSVTLTVEGTSISVTNTTNSVGDVWLTFSITELPEEYNIDISWTQSATFNSGSQQDIIVIIATYRDLIYNNFAANDGHSLTLVDFEFQFAYVGNNIVITVYVEDLQNTLAFDFATLNITIKGGSSYLDTAGTLGVYSTIIPYTAISQGINELIMNINAPFFNNISVEFNISAILKAQVRFSLIDPPSLMIQNTEYTITLLVEYLPDGDTTWLPLIGEDVDLYINFGLNVFPFTGTETTDSNGFVSFTFTVPDVAKQVKMTVTYDGNYMIESDSSISNIQLKSMANNNLWIILLIVFIILGMVIGIVISKQKSSKRELPDSIAKEKQRLEKLTQQISEEQSRTQMQPQVPATQESKTQKAPSQEKPRSPEESQILKDIQERGTQKPKIKIQTEVKSVEKPQKGNEPIVFDETPTQKQPTPQQPSKVIIEKQKEQSGKPINQELAQLFDKIEQTTLKLLFNNVIPTKQGLIQSISIELQKLKISASEQQINEVVDKMTEQKKIGFNRKPPAPGWKLII